MDGIINLLKPAGMTSHDAVAYIHKIVGKHKVGHTGTLDPMAVGVLPICIGKATRISEYLLSDKKKYRCEMTLGIQTDTQDVWGSITENNEVNVSKEKITEAFNGFIGEIEQIPPNFSAIKVKGKKLYEYAREGLTVEAKPRKVTVYDLKIV